MNEERTPRWRRRLGLTLGLAVLLLSMNALVGCVLARHEAATAPRDPDTGILLGAEERDLGPEDADRAVLFIHGFLGGSSNFADLPDRVADAGWRVRCMRLPGHGTSPVDFAATTPDELVEAVRAEAEALREDYSTLVLAGHSMGGTLSVITAAEVPVDGLVLGAPYFGVTYRPWYVLRPETWGRITAPFVPWVYKGKLFLQLNRREVKDEVLSYTWVASSSIRTLTALGERVNAPRVLERIDCPVLWLHAPGDRAASLEAARRAFDAMPAADKRAVTLARSNHHIFWDYDQAQVFDAVLEFLDGLVPTDATP